MLSHEEMVGLQRESHDLIDGQSFKTKEQYTLHLMHTFAYECAAALAKDKHVLDLGCNTGYGSDILSQKAKSVNAVDVSDKAIEKAKSIQGEKSTPSGQNPIDFQVIDGKTLPFADDSFDVIVSCQVIEHIVDHTLYMGELKRVLARCGVVFFTTPNATLRLYPGMKPWNKFHVREYTASELADFVSGYFPAFEIFGLQAQDPLHSIEKNRLTNERENARRRQEAKRRQEAGGSPPKADFSWRKAAKALLPGVVVDVIRRVLGKELPDKSVSAEWMEKHGTESFSYEQANLDEALDLMALCALEAEPLSGARELIEKL